MICVEVQRLQEKAHTLQDVPLSSAEGHQGLLLSPFYGQGGHVGAPKSPAVLGSLMRKYLSSKISLSPWLIPSDCPGLHSERRRL